MTAAMLADANGDLIAGVIGLVIVCLILGGIKSAIDKLTAPKRTDFVVNGHFEEHRR